MGSDWTGGDRLESDKFDYGDDSYGNKLTHGYGRFFNIRYKHKGRGKFKLSQCKLLWFRENFTIPVSRTVYYTAKEKNLGLAKCKQCNYITAERVARGTRCPCCSYKLSNTIRKAA